MNTTEVIPCIQTQLSSLSPTIMQQNGLLSSLQYESLGFNVFILIMYSCLMMHKATAARKKVLAAVIAGMVVCYMPTEWLNNTQYYSAFALIYLASATAVINKKVKYSCVIMALFSFVMVLDRKINNGIETWTYQNYEVITCLIHVLIVCSFVKWNELRIMDRLGKMLDRVYRWISDSRVMAPV